MLNDLGIVDSAQNRAEEVRKEYKETLKIYRLLAQKNPESYLPEVAQTLNNLGIVDIALNRAEEDRKAFKEALKIYRELEQKNPGTYLPCVATTLNNLGALHAKIRIAVRIVADPTTVSCVLQQPKSIAGFTTNNIAVLPSQIRCKWISACIRRTFKVGR
jgi:tetratricopeptide (TPR) repeat protein